MSVDAKSSNIEYCEHSECHEYCANCEKNKECWLSDTPKDNENLCTNSNRIESTNKLICESDCGFECENRGK